MSARSSRYLYRIYSRDKWQGIDASRTSIIVKKYVKPGLPARYGPRFRLMAASPIDTYRRQIERELQAGNATEHTHRPALKTLIESLAPGLTATNEPRRVECGAPDFVISRKAAHGPVTLGHIEAKDVGKDLDDIERSEQMKRYLHALPNLILTDCLEFRCYVEGEHRQTARLAHIGKGGKLAPEKNGIEAVSDLLTAFPCREAEPINDPKALALRIARLTHFIRDVVVHDY